MTKRIAVATAAVSAYAALVTGAVYTGAAGTVLNSVLQFLGIS